MGPNGVHILQVCVGPIAEYPWDWVIWVDSVSEVSRQRKNGASSCDDRSPKPHNCRGLLRCLRDIFCFRFVFFVIFTLRGHDLVEVEPQKANVLVLDISV